MRGDQAMRFATLLLFTLPALAVLTSTAGAEPYWISYDGNDFPENEGWTREYGDENGHGQGGAVRSIEDGALVLDGLRHVAIYDAYTMSRPIDPAPDELFIMRWRLRVDEVSAREDPAVVAFSDDSWGVGFQFSESYVESTFEDAVTAAFEAGVFHLFELRSYDMRQYELLIDGEVALVGPFFDTITASEVGWGDAVTGSASLSRWDYFEFGVVPEPCSAATLSVAGAVALFLRRRAF